MVDIGNMIWVSIFGFILIAAATLSLAWVIFNGKKKKRTIIALILLVFFGLLIFGLSLQEISRIHSLGRPMAYKDLKNGSGYEVMGAIGNFVIIGLEKENNAEVRAIFNFPKKLEIGTKFSKRDNEIIEEISLPKEIPKLEI